MVINFFSYVIKNIAFLTIFIGLESFASDTVKEEPRDYIRLTQEDFVKSVRPYFKDQKNLKKYLDKYYASDSDMHSIFDAYYALEGLPNDVPEYQQGLDFYTDRISATVGGAKSEYDRQTIGARHGISLNQKITLQDLRILIAAAIHTGLNDKYYQGISTNVVIRHFDKPTVNRLEASDLNVRKHRAIFFSFLMLAVFLEQEINYKMYGLKTDRQGKPRRNILTYQDLENESGKIAWEKAVSLVSKTFRNNPYTVVNHFSLYDPSLKREIGIVGLLNKIKPIFLEYFIPIANMTNDRKHGIVREPIILEDEIKPILLDSVAQGESVLKEENIILGEKLEERDIKFEITKGGMNQIVFINEGGPKTFQRTLKDNAQIESIVVPIILVKNFNVDFNDSSRISEILSSRREFALIKGNESLRSEEARRLEELYNSGKLIILSTEDPGKDGIFAYIPAGLDGNQETEFRMIAKPLGDLNLSIAKVQKNRLANLARGISLFLSGSTGLQAREKKPKELTIAFEDLSGTNFNWNLNPKVGIAKRNPLMTTQFYQSAKPEKGIYLVAYGKGHERHIVHAPEINGNNTFIESLGVKELYEQGFFQLIEDSLFYVHVGLKGSDTRIYALNVPAKEIAEKNTDSYKRFIAQVEKTNRDYMHNRK